MIGTLTGKLNAFGICTPEKPIEAVHLDQHFTVGNIVVRHHADLPPKTRYTK